MSVTEQPILLFDGDCGFCHAWVRFVLRHEQLQRVRFCRLQSAVAQQILRPQGIENPGLDTIYLVDGGRVLQRSAAVLHIIAGLRAPWRWLGVFRFVPVAWRDALYDFVGRWRQQLPGQIRPCLLPDELAASRFIKD